MRLSAPGYTIYVIEDSARKHLPDSHRFAPKTIRVLAPQIEPHHARSWHSPGLRMLEKHGRIPRGYLGLGLQPVRTDGGHGRGAMIMSVEAEGPGAAAGLYQGDIIVTWDGAPVSNVNTLLRALGPSSVGQAVTLGLRRNGQSLDVPLTVGERPPA